MTWIRDSHGLFDYESKSISKKSCKTAIASKIVRIENDIDIVQLGKNVQDLGESAQTLLQIKADPSKPLPLLISLLLELKFALKSD